MELAGFIVGIVGAIWMKSAMNLLNRERERAVPQIARPRRENPAMEAFRRGLSLVLLGLGMETFARLFLY